MTLYHKGYNRTGGVPLNDMIIQFVYWRLKRLFSKHMNHTNVSIFQNRPRLKCLKVFLGVLYWCYCKVGMSCCKIKYSDHVQRTQLSNGIILPQKNMAYQKYNIGNGNSKKM